MSDVITRNAAWHTALTIHERSVPATSDLPDDELERAERRLERWRAAFPGDDALFARRLASDGLDLDKLRALLGAPAAPASTTAPAWSSSFEIALSEAAPDSAEREEGLLTPFTALIDQAHDRLAHEIDRLIAAFPDAPFDASVIEMLADDLPDQLNQMVARTGALELYVARLSGAIAGDSADERLAAFLERLRQPEHARAFREEYATLTRAVVERLNQWVETSAEFLRRLCEDWDQLHSALGLSGAATRVVEIEGGAGDRHRHGRSVMIVRLDSGERAVYKPRSLALDGHVQELLVWLNDRGMEPPLAALRLLDRGSHGWVSFVDQEPCLDEEAVHRFYQRMGALLALIYALHGTDFHYENVIAAGEHPVLIDLESLFQPRIGEAPPPDGMSAIQEALGASVIGSGLLPQQVWSKDGQPGVDLSGIGGAPDQALPDAAPTVSVDASGEVAVVRETGVLPRGNHRPALNSALVDPVAYLPDVLDGFTRAYQIVLEHRDSLLAAGGPLQACAGDEIRVIFRPTRIYGLLLLESFHPDLLRDALDRDRYFDQLWVEAPSRPYVERIIPSERAAMLGGDIPLFTTHADSKDVFDGDDRRIEGVFTSSGLEMARRRLRGMGAEDLARQRWLIHASFATLPSDDTYDHWRTSRQVGEAPAATRDRLLDATRGMAERLDTLAIRGGDQVMWLGVSAPDARSFTLGPVALDLYDGLPGIALFLATLGDVTGETRWTELARAATASIEWQLDHGAEPATIGGFSGSGGLIYTLVRLAALWQRDDLLDRAQALALKAAERIAQDQTYDLLGGSAGLIAGLLSLYQARPSDQILAIVTRCGDHLLGAAIPQPAGVGWVMSGVSSPPLTGFSHGAAGFAWALTRLATATGEPRFREAAEAAIAYERSLFNPVEGNWPDLRPNPDGEPSGCLTLWCHGAPGIGLGRLAMNGASDHATRAEIATALTTTLHEGFGITHCLCHGDLGNLELVERAAAMLDDERAMATAQSIAARILREIAEDGPHTGAPLGVENPGLMTGLAGIGYALLRLAAPERVPSVLTLESASHP